MSGTPRIPAADITGFKGSLIKRFARRTLGTVPTSIGVYWHHQQVLMDMASVGKKVQKWERCDEQLKSFAHMVVASRVGGVPEVVDDGESGFLHAPEDVDGMARSVLALLRDPDLHRRMGAAGRRAAVERFGSDQVVPRYEAAYAALLDV